MGHAKVSALELQEGLSGQVGAQDSRSREASPARGLSWGWSPAGPSVIMAGASQGSCGPQGAPVHHLSSGGTLLEGSQ